MTDEVAVMDTPGGNGNVVHKKMLTKADIVAARDIQYDEVEVPEWGGFVTIKTMSGKERDAFEASMIQGVGKAQRIDMQNVRAKFCSLIIVDPDTKERMFLKPEIDQLAAKSAPALERVYNRGMELSRFTKEDIEELVKNSDSDQPVV
jgi:hypothetical protein